MKSNKIKKSSQKKENSLKWFFNKLNEFNRGVINDNNIKLALKYYINPNSFSFTLHKEIKLRSNYIFFNFLEDDYTSEIFYTWNTPKAREKIIKECIKQIELFK